jgi:hypothetical protein
MYELLHTDQCCSERCGQKCRNQAEEQTGSETAVNCVRDTVFRARVIQNEQYSLCTEAHRSSVHLSVMYTALATSTAIIKAFSTVLPYVIAIVTIDTLQ